MANELKGMTISLKASAEVTKADKFKPVKVSGERTFALAGAEDTVVGVIQNECKAGEAGQILIQGITFFKCTGVVAAGAAIGTWGIALNSGAIGDVISVLIK